MQQEETVSFLEGPGLRRRTWPGYYKHVANVTSGHALASHGIVRLKGNRY